MAVYHCSVSNVSRGKGSNACATLSYIIGQRVTCSRTGETFCYGRCERVAKACAVLPQSAPQRYLDPAILFDELESFEKSSNARVAKKVVVALPRESDVDEWRDMLDDFVAPLSNGGWPCAYAIHTDEDGHNPHAHILIANRQLDENGEWKKAKTKKVYALDDDGNRIPQLDENGEQKLGKRNERLWKRTTVSANLLDQRETLVKMRESWADVCNARLEPAAQIDHRSHETRGLETVPTVHEGYAARAIEQRGGVSRRCETNRRIRTINDYIRSLMAKIAAHMQRIQEQVQEQTRSEAAKSKGFYLWRMPKFAKAPDDGRDMEGMSAFIPADAVKRCERGYEIETSNNQRFSFQRRSEKNEEGQWQQIPTERREPPVSLTFADAIKVHQRALADNVAYRTSGQEERDRQRAEAMRAAERDYGQQTGISPHHRSEDRHRGR